MIQLGFLDEPVTEHYADQVNFTTNKLGGFPDWVDANNARKKIMCKVCGSVTPLLLQIYAPINERANYHRTLYIFACVNATCWDNPESWKCLKRQTLIESKKIGNSKPIFTLDDWPSCEDEWSCSESNNTNQSSCINEAASLIDKISLNEENGNEFPQLALVEAQFPIATAEIEPDENEPITVDSPILPQCDLVNLLKSKPKTSKIQDGDIFFTSWFISAFEEKIDQDPLSEHVQDLLSEYTKVKDNWNSLKTMNNVNVVQQSDENYEKSSPAHGDKLFHSFLSRVKANPDQILRYSRNNEAPLFFYKESSIPTKCKHCCGDLVFELQILPTIINYLKLSASNFNENHHLEFGSVFVYTCKASCDKSEEESIIVQYEQF